MLDVKYYNLEVMFPLRVRALVSQDMADDFLRLLAEAARSEWIRLAGNRLHTTRRDYIYGIQPIEYRPGVAVIQLVGVLPNMIESGITSPIDQRMGFLGPKVPLTKKHKGADGKFYRHIPFRHGTLGTIAVGPAMGSAYGEKAKEIGQAVYVAAKKLAPNIESLAAGYAPKLKPRHTTDIYAGMRKYQSADGKHTQYKTFRTISENSAPDKWIIPPRQGLRLGVDVGKYVEQMGGTALIQFVNGVLGR